MKKIFLLSNIVALGFAYSTSVVMPYGSYIDYSGSSKDNAKLGGIYYSYYKFPIKIEMDAEYLKINYKKNIPDWKQKDFTFKTDYFYENNWIFKAGIHNLWVKQYDNNYHYNKVLFGGLDYYKYLKYNMGIDYYYSDYKNFNVSQFSPKFGFNFGNYYSTVGSFYLEGKYNHIHISKKNIAPDDTYNNFDIKLQNFYGHWTTTLKTTFGKFAYKVANDGFVVYNTGDEYKYGYGLSVNYNFEKVNNIKISYERDKFEDESNAYSNIYLLSYSRAF
ncbi:conserved hypothetical protein [Lebetimonas natsushimae]|uniref:Uncharacterized protein n=1 Tax=Lebetimonas natsushimae TaxID=1936991 RepID=A0A292YG82_9BACT|nr:hypothetical protein [Lebetimonas natsushimae]GAX88069.1 conserved hypothetical protein [Lebetimonas natsushimae]